MANGMPKGWREGGDMTRCACCHVEVKSMASHFALYPSCNPGVLPRIASLPQPPDPMPRLTPEQARIERDAIVAALRAACEGSALRLDNAFVLFMGVRP